MAAPARRRASRALAPLLAAAALVIYGATGSGAFAAGWRPSSGVASAAAAAPQRRLRPGRVSRRAEPGGPRPLAGFSVGEVVDGRVAFKIGGKGAFLDVGGEKCALLQAPKALAMKLRPNETLTGLRVTKIDPAKGFFDVVYDGFAEYMKDRSKPISEFAVDDVLPGRVVEKSYRGVFLDVGAECDAKLRAPFAMAIKLNPNETLSGLRVTKIDKKKTQMWVECPQLEETIRDRWKPVSSFAVGDIVNGRMITRRRDEDRAFLDINAQVDALLDSTPKLRKNLRKGDVLEGVRVTEVNEEKKILKVAFDGLEAFLKEKGRM